MTKKNKHLLKLLSLSLLPIAVISIPAVVLTSCSSGKEESNDNSNNNQPNNPGDNGGEDNNNPAVTNPTYPTFASADEVRKACDEAKIDSKYESEPTFITTHSNPTPADENYAYASIYYPQNENAGDMNYMYINVMSKTKAPVSTNFADYPIYALKDGQKYYINPNKAVLLDKIPELYMLSDEQLKNDSLEVSQTYLTYRNREIWFKVDVSDVKEELKDFIPDSTNYKNWFFIDWNSTLPNINYYYVDSYVYESSDKLFSLNDLWTYRLSNDMRFGLTDIFGLDSFVDMDYYDNPDRFPHPTSTTYSPETIDPNKFGGVVAMKYLKQYPNAVRFIDSITFNAGVSEGCSISSEQMWSTRPNYAYEMRKHELVPIIKGSLLPINQYYNQFLPNQNFPTLNIDAKKMYDNVDLSTLQLKELENGLNWYVTSDSIKLIDLLVTVNGGKTFGYLNWEIDFSDINDSTNTSYYGLDTSISLYKCDMGISSYYPNYGFSDDNSAYVGLFTNFINKFSYSTFIINFNQPNSK